MTSTTTATTTSTTSNNSNNSNSNAAAATTSCSIEAEYNKFPDRNAWHRFYQEIREQSDREAHEKQYGTIESEKPHNRCLNRYRDVNPYDHSRIIIHRGTVDYINANLVKLERADRKYILTQGPLKDTVGHFWLMIWEQNTRAILMLNKLIEKKQNKCDLYWPDRKGAENALKLDEVKLSVEFLRCEEYKNFCRRLFKLTDLESNQSREIIQFHYTTWPDFGIPSSPVAFLQFLKQVRDSGALDPDIGPAVVHCSAGIGRSGTFCLVDCCLVLIEKEGENNVSVQDVLYEMRRYRMGLIQTADQLYFSYQAIIEGIKLLKDPNFLDYTEAPLIRNDDQQHSEQFNLDETPPPLPPRTHSLLPLAGCGAGGALTLNLRAAQGKPLPNIPASESFNDDLYAPDNNLHHQYTDALNNFINNERLSDNMSNRPLPPLPTSLEQALLDRVHESESDENDSYDDYDSDEIDSDDDDDDDNSDDNIAADERNANNKNNMKNIIITTTATHDSSNVTKAELNGAGNGGDGEINDMKLSNGIESGGVGNNRNAMNPDNELKRRKRAERQANIEQKVSEIKRKQREAEEGKQAAKKRRSIVTYIAAGVVVGVICIYAYSKFT